MTSMIALAALVGLAVGGAPAYSLVSNADIGRGYLRFSS